MTYFHTSVFALCSNLLSLVRMQSVPAHTGLITTAWELGECNPHPSTCVSPGGAGSAPDPYHDPPHLHPSLSRCLYLVASSSTAARNLIPIHLERSHPCDSETVSARAGDLQPSTLRSSAGFVPLLEPEDIINCAG